MSKKDKDKALHASAPAESADDGLDPMRRRIQNKSTASFLIIALGACALVSSISFQAYIWSIEIACGVIYIAMFLFAYGIRDYSTNSSSIYSGIGFLFTFAFEAIYLYLAPSPETGGIRLSPPRFSLWTCIQWYQAFAFLLLINHKRPKIGLLGVVAIYSSATVLLLASHFIFPNFEVLLQSSYGIQYLAVNAVALVIFHCLMLMRLWRARKSLPGYFAARTLAALVASGIACLGLIVTFDASPVLAFAFYFVRFLSLALCYNATVTFTLQSPYRRLYDQLLARADELAASNSRLKEALAEKEILLGEVHHRVKNNLQVVASLLSLHAFHNEDASFREAMDESQDRIRAMALVHETLYQEGNFADIDFSKYMGRLVREFARSRNRQGIECSIECDPIHLPIDTAITCSLLVNELISNCFKHAFPADKGGTILVRLLSKSEEVEIWVEDDGIGIPAALKVGELDTMGFSLLSGLTAQLRGSYEMRRGKGTKTIIRFPLSTGPVEASAPIASPA